MVMKETLKKYMLQKLQQMEEARRKAHKVPSHVIGMDYRNAIMEDMREAMIEMIESGLVEDGKTLNDHWFHLNPENALE